MNEIDIINYLRKIINNSYALNLNDDVFFDNKKSLLASMDTYNEKIHFLNFKNPDLVIKKAIRSSISDIISKGANPKYLLLSFSGPKKSFTKKNLKLMSNSIKKEQKKYGFFLIGGDTNLDRFGVWDGPIMTAFESDNAITDACHFLECGTESIDRFFFRNSDSVKLTPTSWRFADEFITEEGDHLSDHYAVHVGFQWERVN